MFRKLLIVALCCYLVSAAPLASQDQEKPDPYSFSFEETDEYGNKISRQESGDERGVIQGQYSYIDAAGLTRTVQYIADDDGFRANVISNEPGLINSAPAGATYSIQ